jgi:hypothetical protein
MEEVDAVAKPLIMSAVRGGGSFIGAALRGLCSVLCFVLATAQEAGSPKEIEFELKVKKEHDAEVAAAAGGAGKGGKGTKDRGKDFSPQGTVDQLRSIQQDQKIKNINDITKSKQNVDNANRKL